MIFLAARVLAVCCCAGLAGAQTCSELACENSPCSSAEYCSGHGVCLETTAAYENQGGGGRWACECLDSDQGAWEGPECEYNLPVCCAEDGNCEDGTDDWCCGEHYYCSHDSEKQGPDTPGPNEAKAAAALQKIGPQVMNMSSGCIFCIPHDQVGSEQMEKLYSHINIYMGGKAVNHGF